MSDDEFKFHIRHITEILQKSDYKNLGSEYYQLFCHALNRSQHFTFADEAKFFNFRPTCLRIFPAFLLKGFLRFEMEACLASIFLSVMGSHCNSYVNFAQLFAEVSASPYTRMKNVSNDLFIYLNEYLNKVPFMHFLHFT